MEQSQKIVQKSTELFMKYGVRNVSMDEISNEIGISKKTLYQFFENKSDLINQSIQIFINHEIKICDAIVNLNKNPVDEIFEISAYVKNHLAQLQSSLVYELKKYYKQGYQMIDNHLNNYVFNLIRKNLSKGIETSYYRSEIDVDVIARFYVSLAILIWDDHFISSKDYQPVKLLNQFLEYHLHGIVPQEGLVYLRKKLENEI